MSGSFFHSLVATDICTGWTEAVPLLAREQSLVVEGLEAIGQRLPFRIRGIDSDNDGVFINETLIGYCADQGIEFIRSRAYRSNDQAWIEQKNGSVVRRFVGHDRYSGQVAGQTMAHLYGALRLYVNFFQPSFKYPCWMSRVFRRFRADRVTGFLVPRVFLDGPPRSIARSESEYWLTSLPG